MTVPTGGGKTLASLNFALDHALRWGKQRVIYTAPFTSIIEQTADVFRAALDDDNAILEHHSNFDWDKQIPKEDDSEGEGREGLAKLRRDAENWDAPIIVTTAVQLFESLFARRTSRCRKLHNIANSVIILDEAQTMPVHLLRPCMAALDELARNYGASIVLCTATQPALRIADGALPRGKNGQIEGFDIDAARELAPRPVELYQTLKRVTVEWRKAETDDATIAARFAEAPQMLCIVNNRRHARELFEQVAGLDGARHLTTLMCARHRRKVLADIREDLSNKRPVRLIATSLIEAGVDVDFPEVWRAATGLDSIAQAAGRCNREGKLDTAGRVVVFEAAGHKNPPVIQAFWQAGRAALRQAEANGHDPLGLEAVHAYFNELYFQKGHEALDAASLDGLPFRIIPEIEHTARELAFPFASISDAFRMIDDVMEPVLIPYDDEARRLLDALEAAPVPPAGTLRKLQQYSVSIPKRAFETMLKVGAVQAIKPDAYGARFMRLVNDSLYHPEQGLDFNDPTWRSAECNVI
jgi:CRISPR-associated endonuclease/helicase Cas3